MIPASRFKRCVAYIVDIIVFIIMLMPIIILFTFLTLNFPEQRLLWKLSNKFIGMIGVLLYFAWFESSKYLASPGKKLLNLYVSDDYNQRLSFKTALNRVFLLMIPGWLIELMQGFVQGFSNTTADPAANQGIAFMRGFIQGIAEANTEWTWILISMIIWSIWCLPIYFTKERKTVYDMLSSTRVNSRGDCSEQLKKDLEAQGKMINELKERLDMSGQA